MATLKDHQQAMVDLLASGSGIPASASRLAHAMHDVLSAMLGDKKESFAEEMTRLCNERIEATTPGLNDKALAGDLEACRPKATPAERRVKELENTINQLRASNAKLRKDNEWLKCRLSARDDAPEQAGCRKPDTLVCNHKNAYVNVKDRTFECPECGLKANWPVDFDLSKVNT
ncbi:hypothetical protein MLA71_003433 [Salmonella enterica subsp. enterica serovar Infantis]|nr:hypothetical protein [Salmonella enterica subsp. enterica serovar Infantis]